MGRGSITEYMGTNSAFRDMKSTPISSRVLNSRGLASFISMPKPTIHYLFARFNVDDACSTYRNISLIDRRSLATHGVHLVTSSLSTVSTARTK